MKTKRLKWTKRDLAAQKEKYKKLDNSLKTQDKRSLRID